MTTTNPLQQPIYQPSVGTTWQYILQGPITLDSHIEEHEVYIVDLFDSDISLIHELHRRGRKVIAYFSAGSYEEWRPDALRFDKKHDMGRKLDGWDGEKWLSTRSTNVRNIMLSRLDLALSKGFDGVDPDNIDGYDNKNGLGLTTSDAAEYITFLARESHLRGLAIGLKNAGDLISSHPQIVDIVQWCVQEQCVEFDEESTFVPFIARGKPVFHVEYPKGDDPDNKKMNNDRDVTMKQRDKAFRARKLGFSTIIKNVRLDQWIQIR